MGMKYTFVETRKKGREEDEVKGGEEGNKKKRREEEGRKGERERGRNQKENSLKEKNIVMEKHTGDEGCCLDGIHLPSDFTGISESKKSFPWCTISVGT